MSGGPDGHAPSHGPAVTVLMIVLGFLLLLPGACRFFFASKGFQTSVGALGFLISVGGVVMIGSGIRRLFVPPDAAAGSEKSKFAALLVLLAVIVLATLILSSLLSGLGKVPLRN